MLRSYFKIAFRNLSKQKLTSSINILGLAVGLTCCILVLLYVQFEFSFDSFHNNKDNIYQVIWSRTNYGHDSENSAVLPIPFYETLKSTFPEVINSTKVYKYVSNISFGTKELKRQDIIYADSSFFDVFTFPITIGDKKTPLNRPDKAVLTEEFARNLFGNENPLGKTVTLMGKQFIVTALLKDIPHNSSFQFTVVLPFAASYIANNAQFWRSFGIEGYIQLPDNYPPVLLQSKLDKFINTHLKKNLGENNKAFLQPLSRMHLYSMKDYGIDTSGSIIKVYVYSIIALLTLLLACINFINHSISSLTSRYKEVGIRKIVGAERKQIFIQYMNEILLTCGISIMLSLLAVGLLLPKFNILVNKSIIFDLTDSNISAILLLLVVSCLLAGSFPAIMISKFSPSEVLSKKLKISYRSYFSEILLTVQFSLSIFFFISLIIMSKQIDAIFNKHSIEDTASIVEFNISNVSGNEAQYRNSLKYFRNEVVKDKGVMFATLGHGSGMAKELIYEGKELSGFMSPIGSSYFETYGIKAIEGRAFDLKNYPSDSSEAVVINKSFARINNLYSPVGKYIRLREGESLAKTRKNFPDMFEGDPYPDKEFQIVGVVDDFTKRKLTKNYEPQIFRLINVEKGLVAIKIDKRNYQSTLNNIKEIYTKAFPGAVFRYYPLDELINRTYSGELKEKELLEYSSAFVLLITVFGVFGFTFLNITKRTKEIGIRKVIGASLNDILILLTKKYIVLLILALILSIPAAYYFMYKWIENFVVRTPLTPWYFILGGLTVMVVILASVCFHVIKTARANPVDSLKSE